MSTFTYVKAAWSSGDVINASDFNGNFERVRDFLIATKLDDANLQKNIGSTKLVFTVESIQNETKRFHFKVPAGVTLEWEELFLAFESGGGALELVVEDDSATVLAGGPLLNGTAGSVTNHRTFTGDSAAGSEIEVVVEETDNVQCANVTVTLWAGSKVRS